jgi:hypothetical protein
MKKVLLFSSGFVAGIIAIILVAILINIGNQPNYGLSGLTVFPKKGECIKTSGEIEVFQVLKPNMALARTGDFPDGIVVLLVNYDDKSYYDEQKIKIPADKCARQRGTYQYTTKDETIKTVPAVVIEEYDQKNSE